MRRCPPVAPPWCLGREEAYARGGGLPGGGAAARAAPQGAVGLRAQAAAAAAVARDGAHPQQERGRLGRGTPAHNLTPAHRTPAHARTHPHTPVHARTRPPVHGPLAGVRGGHRGRCPRPRGAQAASAEHARQEGPPLPRRHSLPCCTPLPCCNPLPCSHPYLATRP
eukprot:scaffold125081_cov33-Phaeocystis_antarctica.AAC.1